MEGEAASIYKKSKNSLRGGAHFYNLILKELRGLVIATQSLPRSLPPRVSGLPLELNLLKVPPFIIAAGPQHELFRHTPDILKT